MELIQKSLHEPCFSKSIKDELIVSRFVETTFYSNPSEKSALNSGKNCVPFGIHQFPKIMLTRETTSEMFTSPLSSISPYFSTLAALSVEPKM